MKINPILAGALTAAAGVGLYLALRKNEVVQSIINTTTGTGANTAEAVAVPVDYAFLPIEQKRQILLTAMRQIGFTNDSNPQLAEIANKLMPQYYPGNSDLPSIFIHFYDDVAAANGYENKYRAITQHMNAAGFNVDLHRTHSTGVAGILKSVSDIGATLVSIAAPVVGKR